DAAGQLALLDVAVELLGEPLEPLRREADVLRHGGFERRRVNEGGEGDQDRQKQQASGSSSHWLIPFTRSVFTLANSPVTSARAASERTARLRLPAPAPRS